MPSLLRPLLVALTLLAAVLPAGAGAREHGIHGTVRRLCADAVVRHWPGGPVAGRLARGVDVRRFDLGKRYALGVTQGHRPVVRGYVPLSAFCAPSARGRAALDRAAELALRPGRGRPATPLAHPVFRRVCADEVYLRDRPLNRAVSLLYRGDAVMTDRRARNPWRGGMAYGHANRRGFVPEAAFCHGISKRLPGHALVTAAAHLAAGAAMHAGAAADRAASAAAGSSSAGAAREPAAGDRAAARPASPASARALEALRVLAPPAAPSCGRRIDGKRLLQVGATIPRGLAGDGLSVTARVLRDGKPVSVAGARFTGRRGRVQYAAGGALACRRAHVLEYAVRRGGKTIATLRWTVTPGEPARASDRSVTGTTGATGATGPAATGAAAAPARARVALEAAATPSRLSGPARLAAAVPAACAGTPGKKFAHGGNGPVDHRFHVRPALSADGRYVAFDTPGRLLPADHDDARDVYRRDLRTGALVLVSKGGGAGKSRAPAISADGSRIAFESDAPGLVPEDRDRLRDVLVADLRTGETVRASAGAARTPALSGDGSTVAYERTDTRALVVQRVGGAVLRSVPGAFRPALDADGGIVAYETIRPVGARDANRDFDVARLTVAGGKPDLVSAGRDGRAPRGTSLSASLSADGSVVAFQSDAGGIVKGDRNGLRDVFVRRGGATTRVSVDRCGGDANGYSRYPSLSADGRAVAFDSHAGDLTRADTDKRGHVYRARIGEHPRLVDTRPGGAPSSRTAFSPALSADGRTVAFPTFGYDLGVADTNHRVDVYTRRGTARPHRAG